MWNDSVTTLTHGECDARWRRLWVLVFGLSTGFAFRPAVAQTLPRPTRYVEDRAGVLDPVTENRLLGYLQELEQKTTAQFIVLTVPTTDGVPIEQFALRLAERWKLGQKGKDNGLLLVVAVKDRKYRFETGYGLEGPLPDSFLGSVGRNNFVPHFRRGDYSKGIEQGVRAILSELAKHYHVELSGVPKLGATARNAPAPCALVPCLFFLLLFFILGNALRRGPWIWWLPIFIGSSRHSRTSSRSWSSGSGGFGGGFGSFGGGGGGSFGGGGSSGSW